MPLLRQQRTISCNAQETLVEGASSGKRLIFTHMLIQPILYENLNPDGELDDIEVVYSSDKNKAKVAGYLPQNPIQYRPKPGETELSTLITTDVLAEGLNLRTVTS